MVDILVKGVVSGEDVLGLVGRCCDVGILLWVARKARKCV